MSEWWPPPRAWTRYVPIARRWRRKPLVTKRGMTLGPSGWSWPDKQALAYAREMGIAALDRQWTGSRHSDRLARIRLQARQA